MSLLIFAMLFSTLQECLSNKYFMNNDRYHVKRMKNNIAVKKFREEKSTKDTVKKIQLHKVLCFDSKNNILAQCCTTQIKEENERLEKSTAEAKGGLDQIRLIFQAHAKLVAMWCSKDCYHNIY